MPERLETSGAPVMPETRVRVVEVTMSRNGSKVAVVGQKELGSIPGQFDWDALCSFLIEKMVRDNIIPDPAASKLASGE